MSIRIWNTSYDVMRDMCDLFYSLSELFDDDLRAMAIALHEVFCIQSEKEIYISLLESDYSLWLDKLQEISNRGDLEDILAYAKHKATTWEKDDMDILGSKAWKLHTLKEKRVGQLEFNF